jgi:hypothetical protein
MGMWNEREEQPALSLSLSPLSLMAIAELEIVASSLLIGGKAFQSTVC